MLFSSLFTSSRLGVSVSDATLECVEVRMGARGRVSVRAVSQVALEPGTVIHGKVTDLDRFAHALKEAVTSARPTTLQSRSVYLALPDEVTYVHRFRFPGSVPDKEIATALAFQSEEVIPLPQEDVISDFVVVSRSTEETVVGYAAASREAVSGYLAAFSRAGFSVAGIGLDAQALSRALLAAPREGKASLVVDLGSATSTLFLRDQYGVCASFSSATGGEAFTQAVLGVKKMTREKAEALKQKVGVGTVGDADVRKALGQVADLLVEDVRHVLDWHIGAHPNTVLDELVFSGGTSLLPGLVEWVSTALAPDYPGITVRTGEAFGRVSQNMSGETLVYASAFGAALHTLDTSDPSFNFFAGSRRSRVKATAAAAPVLHEAAAHTSLRERFSGISERQKLILAGLLLIVAFVALGGAWVWRSRSEQNVRANLEALQQNKRGVLVAEPFVATLVLSTQPAPGEVLARSASFEVTVPNVRIVPADRIEQQAQATGSVTLRNTGNADQTLVAATRLLSEDGILFRLREEVTVPADGFVEVAVYADQPGSQGEIGPSRFTIPGLSASLQTIIYGESSQTMSGGTMQIGTLTDADVQLAAETTALESNTHIEQAMALARQEGEVGMRELVQLTVAEVLPDVPVGSETSEAYATIRYTAHTFFYQEDVLLEYLSEQAMRVWGEEFQGTLLIQEIQVKEKDIDLGRATILLTVAQADAEG